MTWPTAFLWTCVLETPIYFLLLRRPLRSGLTAAVAGICLQWLTHPALWWLFPEEWSYWTAFFVCETAVVAVEGAATALLLRLFGERNAFVRGFAIALLANAFSASLGLLF
ncbi:MAG TPA: hypothetical protein VM052_07400 [Candidatus Limnocylindrales bacterium]|nr:hypothetical protein [Candidatus Limnocylindrales bacterium]